jgi:twitching motility protein PilI
MSAATSALDNPYVLLAQMDSKCRTNAAGLPVDVDTREEWTGVEFALHGKELLTSMGEISEIVSIPPITRIPGVRPWVLGMANMRGMLLPVIDMEKFIYGDDSVTATGTSKRLLVIELGEVFVGLVIENVLGMRHFWVDEKEAELPASVDQHIAPFIEYSYKRVGKNIPVFSMSRLVDSEAFMDVAV